MNRRVLIIGADGMRPDSVEPALMPTYAKLISQGCLFTEYYAAYPPKTRVNMATLTTGVYPGRHGVVNNLMFIPGANHDGLVQTGNDQHLLGFQQQTGQPVVLAPTLGDRLAGHGRRLAVAASSSPGASLLWNVNHPQHVINPSSHYGQPNLRALREELGTVPNEKGASLERARWATRALIDRLLGDPKNQVMTLWLSEPDASQHRYGLGSPEAKDALRVVDDCVAQVLEAIEQQQLTEQIDLLLISDHGHATVDPQGELAEHIACALGELELKADLVIADGFIYRQANAPLRYDDVAKLVAWLQGHDWCDLVLVGRQEFVALSGTLPIEVMLGPLRHHRAPLLAVSCSWSHDKNPYGVPGTVSRLTSSKESRSAHGAASPYEMHAFCLGYGPSFAEGLVSDMPCGTVDIAPTVCALVGLNNEEGFDGRILSEGFKDRSRAQYKTSREVKMSRGKDARGRRPGVVLARVDKTQYIQGTTTNHEGLLSKS